MANPYPTEILDAARQRLADDVEPLFPDDEVVITSVSEYVDGIWQVGYQLLGALHGDMSKELAGRAPILVSFVEGRASVIGFAGLERRQVERRVGYSLDEDGQVVETRSGSALVHRLKTTAEAFLGSESGVRLQRVDRLFQLDKSRWLAAAGDGRAALLTIDGFKLKVQDGDTVDQSNMEPLQTLLIHEDGRTSSGDA